MLKWCATVAFGAVALMGSAQGAQAQGFEPRCEKNVTELCGRVSAARCFEDEALWDEVIEGCSGDIQTMIEMEHEFERDQANLPARSEIGDGSPPDAPEADVVGMIGYSYGGILRAGPGMDYPKVASLQDGDQIQIIENSGFMMDEFAWFKVNTGSGVGYHWGGLFCTEGDNPIAGVLSGCGISIVPLNVFSCSFGSKKATIVTDGSQLTYRYGTETMDEKTISGNAYSEDVHWMQQRFAGIVSQMRFSSGTYSYILYSAEGNAKTGARAISGLVVMKGTAIVSDKQCRSFEEFSPVFDYTTLPRDSEIYSAM